MENNHKNLHLYIPISERCCISPSLSYSRGPASPFRASLKPQRGLTPDWEEEESATGTEAQGQTDKFGLIDFREPLGGFNKCFEICWLKELLPLCLEYQSFMTMGNQQGIKIKTHCNGFDENGDALPKSPRFLIPRKRRRRAEGLVKVDSSQQKFKMTPRTQKVSSKARRPTRFQKMDSPGFGEWDSDEEKHIIFTPASRRKRVLESPQELQPSWRGKPPVVLSSKKDFFSTRDSLSVKEKCVLLDSDTDHSEYDNDVYSTCISPTSLKLAEKSKDNARNTENVQLIRQEKTQEQKAEGGEVKSSQWMYEEMGRKAAAQRVMGKIEELEGIIRQVSLNSAECLKEEEARFILDGEDKEKDRHRAEYSSQKKGYNGDKSQLIEEFYALGEALSQSLRQVLKVEGRKAERKPSTEAEKAPSKPGSTGSTRRPLNLWSHSYHVSSHVPNYSSSFSLSAGRETSPISTPSLSVIQDVSQRMSCMSPILSPLFMSSQPSLPLSLTDRHHRKDISDSHAGWKGSAGDSLFPRRTGGCRSATAAPGGTGSYERTRFSQVDSEPMQMQRSRCTSETDDLLSSGNYHNFVIMTRS